MEVPTDVEYVQTFLREYDGARAPDGMDRVRSLLELLPALKRHAGKRLAVRCAAPGRRSSRTWTPCGRWGWMRP